MQAQAGRDDIGRIIVDFTDNTAMHRFDIGIGGNFLSDQHAGLLTQSFHPDLILLDIRLPDIDGRKVCRSIRENPDFKLTKIMAISGFATASEEEEMLESGFDAFLEKPFRSDVLLSRVQELVKR